MGKRLIFVLAIALALSFSVAAYAEVQNLKVSGDLLMRAVDRHGFTLDDQNNAKYSASGLMTAARVKVDADLTDNVSTTVRLLNERSWGQELTVIAPDTDVSIDLAYVALKEFLYSPLTLTVGRQELRFGNALIIGDVDTNMNSVNVNGPGDLSSRKSFDAIRATLNYDPLVVDAIYSKIDENDYWYLGTGERRDTDLYGVNAKYDLSGMGITGTGEVYYFNRVNRATVDTVGKKDICQTVGFLVGAELRPRLTGSFEFAYQFGDAATDPTLTNTAWMLQRRAWALQSGFSLALEKKWSPVLGLTYTYLSGDKNNNSRYSFWDPMFEDQILNSVVNAILPNTNVMAFNAKASLKPMEDVTVTGVYGYYRLAQAMDAANGVLGIPTSTVYSSTGFFAMDDNKSVGHAFDLTTTYDYTEDVQLGLTFGYFNPGAAFNDALDNNATQLIGSMKVTF